MYVKIQLKHLIIPIIVFGISFISLLYSDIVIIKNPVLDVGFVYTSGDLVEHSSQRLVWDSLLNTTVLPEDASYSNINFESQKVSSKNIDKINEIAKRSEVLFLINFPVEPELEEVFSKNPRTTFVLLNDDYSSKNDNVVTLNVDKEYILSHAAKSLASNTTTHKYLFVDTPLGSDKDFATFSKYVGMYDPSAVIEAYVVNDPSNSIVVREDIINYFSQGYESIFVNDIILNDLLVNICKNYENDIYNYNLKQSELAEDDLTNQTQEKKYLFDTVNLITLGYDNVPEGVYRDTNEDGVIDYHDDGVVLQSYIYDFTNITNEIIKKVSENNTSNKNYILNVKDQSLVLNENNGADQEVRL